MKVLFFAQSRQVTGCDIYVMKTDSDLTLDEFWIRLLEVFPDLETQCKTARLARNETYLPDGEPLHPNDEIAVIPPVSGG